MGDAVAHPAIGTTPAAELTREERAAERRRLREATDDHYWLFSRSSSSSVSPLHPQARAIARRREALDEADCRLPWQHTHAAFERRGQRIAGASHRKAVAKAIADGRAVPADVLAEHHEGAPP